MNKEEIEKYEDMLYEICESDEEEMILEYLPELLYLANLGLESEKKKLIKDTMIAVYASNTKEGINMFHLVVKDDDFSKFFNKLDERPDLPSPDSEILFIENSEIINSYDPFEKA